LQFELKDDKSPVTIADREAEQLLRRRILETFPSDGVLGEEFPSVVGTSPFRWILDPIDGTKSFVSGVPLYANLIGVERNGTGVLGVVNVPALGECVFAAQGSGAWYVAEPSGEPQRASVSHKERLDEALVCVSEVKTFDERGRRAAYDRLQAIARITRTWGDGYGYLLVATGRAEVMLDAAMHVWDAAAVQIVLEEAGGSFTDWQGRRKTDSGDGIGTNGRVLDQVLAVTREFA
jgi:histidinol phosphatase-like enzyme (inositol monophosphatase family)